jgi:NAD-dependent SIR2 family protein deacetylase
VSSIGILTGAGVPWRRNSDFDHLECMKPFDLVSLQHPKPRERHCPKILTAYKISGKYFAQPISVFRKYEDPLFWVRERKTEGKLHCPQICRTSTYQDIKKPTRVYTQNTDVQDRQCKKIPPDRIASVHGSIAEVCRTATTGQTLMNSCDAVQFNIKDIYKLDPQAPETSYPSSATSASFPQTRTVLFGRSYHPNFFKRIQRITYH